MTTFVLDAFEGGKVPVTIDATCTREMQVRLNNGIVDFAGYTVRVRVENEAQDGTVIASGLCTLNESDSEKSEKFSYDYALTSEDVAFEKRTGSGIDPKLLRAEIRATKDDKTDIYPGWFVEVWCSIPVDDSA